MIRLAKKINQRLLQATALIALLALPFITTGCGGGGGGSGFDGGFYGGGLEGTNTDTGLKSFSGVVLKENGAAISGATVEISTDENGESAKTKTGADGSYSLIVPVKPESEVSLVVSENDTAQPQKIKLGAVPAQVTAVTVNLTKKNDGNFEPEFSVDLAPQSNEDPIIVATPTPPTQSPPVTATPPAPSPTPDNNFTPDTNDDTQVLPPPPPPPGDESSDTSPPPPGDESSDTAPPPPPSDDDQDLFCPPSADSDSTMNCTDSGSDDDQAQNDQGSDSDADDDSQDTAVI